MKALWITALNVSLCVDCDRMTLDENGCRGIVENALIEPWYAPGFQTGVCLREVVLGWFQAHCGVIHLKLGQRTALTVPTVG